MKKLFVLLLVLLMIIPTNIVLAENETLQLGKKIQLDFEPGEHKWFIINIETDGIYEFECTSGIRGSITPGASIALFNNDGTAYIIGGRDSENYIENVSISKFQVFIHSGTYNLSVGGKGKTTTAYKKLDTDYQIDKEPNNSINDVITLLPNKYYSGYVDGALPTGKYDESDMYVFHTQKDVNYKLFAEASGDVTFRFLKINDSGESESFLEKDTKKNEIENIWKLNDEVSFPETGTYYIEAVGRHRYSSSSYTNEIGYKFILNGEDNTSISTKPQTTATPVGVKISWENPNNSSYRIYRAEASGTPKAISGVVYGNSFVDVNVESDKKYYYMVVPERDGNISAIDESISAEAVTETIVQPENTGVKNFILMQIGSPNMTVGDKVLEIDPGRGTVPVIQNGRTLVPIRAIVEAMGGTVEWNESEQKVTLNAGGHNVQMTLGQKEFIVDGTKKEMDIAPSTINDRTMLPIRFVTENVGCRIEWIGSTQEIIIVF